MSVIEKATDMNLKFNLRSKENPAIRAASLPPTSSHIKTVVVLAGKPSKWLLHTETELILKQSYFPIKYKVDFFYCALTTVRKHAIFMRQGAVSRLD